MTPVPPPADETRDRHSNGGCMTTLDAVQLSHGAHGPTYRGEVCLVECANRIAAGEISVPGFTPRCDLPKAEFMDDHPSISPVIRAFAIGLNDAWNDAQRQKLKPYATRILCTKTTDADEETRAWLATDWLARVQAPAWLRLAGLEEHARALESLARITDAVTAGQAQPARDAAWAAARDAAWAAARDAARAAARDAAWAAAWAAAREAAREAARDAASNAQRERFARLVADEFARRGTTE